MKRIFPILTLLFALAISFSSCNTRVDLFAGYKDIPVIYGLLDATQDTNYVKIIRAFSNNNENPVSAIDIALIADSNNYPGKLDAKLIELERQYGNHYEPTGRVLTLDTMTLHHKDSGAFYYPNQKIYYTADKLKTNSNNHSYRYRIEVLKDKDTISSETGLVGGDKFKVANSSVTFSSESTNTGRVSFTEAQNSRVYSLKMRFEYTEKLPNQSLTHEYVEWSLGYHPSSELEIVDGCYTVGYKQNALFNSLRNAIGGDTLNATRYIGDFYIMIAAGGSELYNYIEINSSSSSISQNIPDYTNINGGYGVFSSRVNIKKQVKLSASTQRELIGMSGWGFLQRE